MVGSAGDLLDLAELVAVTQDEVHVLVEGLEGADEDAAVLQDAPHPEVNVLQHLAALPHRLDGREERHTNTRTHIISQLHSCDNSITFNLAWIILLLF